MRTWEGTELDISEKGIGLLVVGTGELEFGWPRSTTSASKDSDLVKAYNISCLSVGAFEGTFIS